VPLREDFAEGAKWFVGVQVASIFVLLIACSIWPISSSRVYGSPPRNRRSHSARSHARPDSRTILTESLLLALMGASSASSSAKACWSVLAAWFPRKWVPLDCKSTRAVLFFTAAISMAAGLLLRVRSCAPGTIVALHDALKEARALRSRKGFRCVTVWLWRSRV